MKLANTDEFIASRIMKQNRHHQYLYQRMPVQLAQALKYVHRINEKNKLIMMKNDNQPKQNIQGGNYTHQKNLQQAKRLNEMKEKEILPDYDHIMELFKKMKK